MCAACFRPPPPHPTHRIVIIDIDSITVNTINYYDYPERLLMMMMMKSDDDDDDDDRPKLYSLFARPDPACDVLLSRTKVPSCTCPKTKTSPASLCGSGAEVVCWLIG